jgi:hypothetical protein
VKDIGMDMKSKDWEKLSYNEKNYELFLKQTLLLKEFLEKGAISQAQYDKSLHDLIEKTGYNIPDQ